MIIYKNEYITIHLQPDGEYMISGTTNKDKKFDHISLFMNNRAVCLLNGKYTYIDEKGNYLKKDLWCTYCSEFYKDFAMIYINKKVKYIDINGNFIVDVEFDLGESFNCDNIAIVTLYDKQYKLNTEGYIV